MRIARPPHLLPGDVCATGCEGRALQVYGALAGIRHQQGKVVSVLASVANNAVTVV